MTPDLAITAPAAIPAREVLRKHGRSFHFASKLLGTRHAQRGARLYAFCRHLDDIADETPQPDQAGEALEATRLALKAGYASDPVVMDFIMLAAETNMPLDPALHRLDGLCQDLDAVALTSQAELIRYAYRVAGTVGLMMCAVLDTRDTQALPHAIDLGIAMQLTNIARDIGEDARMGRRYIPGAWVDDAAPADIGAPSPDLQSKLKAATARLLALADRYYASGEAGLHHLPARARLAILVASRVYGAIGRDISKHEYRSWDRRAQVSGPSKIGLALGASHRFFATDTMKTVDTAHDPVLHGPLRTLLRSSEAQVSRHA